MEAMEDLTQEIRLKARYLLLAVPLMERSELSDAELLKRWSALYGEAFLAEVTQQPTDTREVVAQGLADEVYVKLTHDGRIVGLACIWIDPSSSCQQNPSHFQKLAEETQDRIGLLPLPSQNRSA